MVQCVLYLIFWLHSLLVPFTELSLVGLALDLVDLPLSSVLQHCWLGHLTRKIVPEVTCSVPSGALNPTIPYQALFK